MPLCVLVNPEDGFSQAWLIYIPHFVSIGKPEYLEFAHISYPHFNKTLRITRPILRELNTQTAVFDRQLSYSLCIPTEKDYYKRKKLLPL